MAAVAGPRKACHASEAEEFSPKTAQVSSRCQGLVVSPLRQAKTWQR